MQLIPKVFHQIWVGPNPLPDTAAELTASWQRRHPDWQMRLWTDQNLPRDTFNQAIIDQTTIYAQKADILKHELMNRFGGVYIDIDFECLRNIEPLLDGVPYFYGEEVPGRVAHGILGSVPGHPFTRWCQERIPELFPWQRGRILEETGPEFFGRAIAAYVEGCSRLPHTDPRSGREAAKCLAPDDRPPIYAFHPWVVYPYYLGERWVPEDHPDAYAAHHWQKNWDW